MLRIITAGLAVMAMVLFAGIAMAGDYHSGSTLVCSDCHTMHYSASHDLSGGAAPAMEAGGPFARLLKASDPNAVCLTCHDGQTWAPDVLGAHGNGYVREAGALTTGAAPYEDYKGHTLHSTAVAPGGTWSSADGLECVHCHSPHGGTRYVTFPAGYTNAQWRNLNGKVGTMSAGIPFTYAKGTNDPTRDVFETDATLGNLATHYSVNNVQFNEPDATQSKLAQWCQGCHTNFHGKSTDANMNNGSDWVRHPTADVNIAGSNLTRYKGKTNKLKTLVGTATDDYTPSCMTCHKSHGNQNPFGLIYMRGVGTVTEEGDTYGTSFKHMCNQCHGMGADADPVL